MEVDKNLISFTFTQIEIKEENRVELLPNTRKNEKYCSYFPKQKKENSLIFAKQKEKRKITSNFSGTRKRKKIMLTFFWMKGKQEKLTFDQIEETLVCSQMEGKQRNLVKCCLNRSKKGKSRQSFHRQKKKRKIVLTEILLEKKTISLISSQLEKKEEYHVKFSLHRRQKKSKINFCLNTNTKGKPR